MKIVKTRACPVQEKFLVTREELSSALIERDEEIATIETDKIDVSVNAPDAGTIKEFLAKEEDTVTVGQELVRLELGGSSTSSGGSQEATSEPESPASKDQATASDPKPLKLESKETKSNTPPAPQSQDKKPEKKEDALNIQKSSPTPKEPMATKKAEDGRANPERSYPSKNDSPLGDREERRVKMNRMRLRIAERLKQSQNTAASLTTFNEVDMSSLMEFRKLYKEEILKKTGVKLGFMSAFSRACVLAMKDIPAANASIEGPNGGDTIVYRDYVDISVAVATEKGLVTPVVRNAESLDMVGIEKGIAELGKKARDGKLTIEDMAGGTFTISNVGGPQ